MSADEKTPNSVDELCAAALAVVEAAKPTPARSVVMLPDHHIRRLRAALEKVDTEWCEQNERTPPAAAAGRGEGDR